MHLIALLDPDKLYEKALKDEVPYFKFYQWVESTIQMEVFQVLSRRKGGSAMKQKRPLPKTGDKNEKKDSQGVT